MAIYNKHLEEWIDFYIENPLKTWWKARKFFKRPKAEFHFFCNIEKNCPFASTNSIAKLLEIFSCDVGWKDKYNEPRHERDPYIYVCFFRKFGFSINFKVWYNDEKRGKRDGGMYYWEYLLDFLYYRKDIEIVDQWKDMKGNVTPTKQFSIKRKWLKTIDNK